MFTLPPWDPSAADAPTLAALRTRAETVAGTPWPVPRARDYARYFRDGDRDAYEQLIWARDRRLSRAVALAAATRSPDWLDEAADGIQLLCEQSSWCWPAHDDTFSRHGAVVPTVTDPYLDLGASEIAAQLAWADHVLGEQLDARVPGLRARIRHEADVRVLTPFEHRRDWHWLGLDGPVGNWTPWIHGNVLVAATLAPDRRRRERLVAAAVGGLERFAAALPEDGAIDEGYSYWWNGAARLLEALDLLDRPIDGKLRATVAFPHSVHLGGPWYLNHADGQARPTLDQPWAVLHRAARRAGDRAAEAHAAAHRVPGGPVAGEEQGLGRLLLALTDRAWRDAVPGAAGPEAGDVWFPSTQVLIARDPAGLTLAVKGGHNDEHHNHNDVGSVVVALRGVPVLVDPGRPTYTAQTFSERRYELWTMQSGWHNTPVLGGALQEPGRAAAAAGVVAADSGLSLELGAAYPGGHRWRRAARLDRATGRVTVTDTWHLAGRAGGTEIRWMIAGTLRVDDGRAEIDALDGAGTVVLTWPARHPWAVVVRELNDPMLSDVWGERLTRLDITVAEPVGTLELSIEELR
ncbi:heparinase II/III-family protein [Dactylosporangium matsuzakiense]|uniref:Heparinase n=1 Tax=Dactylosporangium matsuzakiense TaxID=53360 RepID=A0A9W6KS04_9ACTN|nr:heparinase II/III-family protein [Dactylosporangium matsuzakiense]UWZ42587.1 heparinase II/III family protein [Dactylosporangium matsuzakiense]GLL06142.1 heparinase [Dactylosporangium matsuzakiense]